MLNFEQFLSESLRENDQMQNLLSRIDPFALEFFRAIEDYSDTTDKMKLSSDFSGAYTFEMRTVERGSYWWCASSEEHFEVYMPHVNYSNVRPAAEREESVERKQSLAEKNITPFYLVELKINFLPSAHTYRVIGLDMKNKTIFTQDIGDIEDKLNQIFDNLMKKYYPTTRTTRKYGL
jgi:hypothetical protein